MIGERVDLTYPYDYLGAGPQTLADVASGAHEFGQVLKQAEHPLVIVGMGALARPDGAAVASLAARAAQARGHGGLERLFGLAHGGITGRRARRRLRARYAAAATRQEMAASGALDVVFLLGADEIEIAPGAFVVYVGSARRSRARTAPTSSFRARPIRRNPAFTSTPKDACRWPAAPRSRRERRAKTGRSCARFRTCSGASFHTTRSPNCASRCSRRIPICSAPIRLRRATARTSRRLPGVAEA